MCVCVRACVIMLKNIIILTLYTIIQKFRVR